MSTKSTNDHWREEDIARAILMARQELRRCEHLEGASLRAVLAMLPGRIIAYAAGLDGLDDFFAVPITTDYIPPRHSSFEQCLAMCQHFATSCSQEQKKVIMRLLKEIVVRYKKVKGQEADDDAKRPSYFYPLEKDNHWGMTVLALLGAFAV